MSQKLLFVNQCLFVLGIYPNLGSFVVKIYFTKLRIILPKITIFVVNYIPINICLHFLITLGTCVSKAI